MERFELARSKEERRKEYEKVIDYLMSHKGSENSRIKDLIKTKPEDFGLNNDLPDLNEFEQKRVDKLFEERQALIDEYKGISDALKGFLQQEDEVWTKLTNINQQICETEGHRLSSKSDPVYDVNDDGRGKTTTYYRTCLICGRRINENMMENYRDCVVKGEEGPKRILYNYKK